MNQQLTPQQVDELISPVPTVRPMSRKEKLLHWAGLIRKLPPNGCLTLCDRLEMWSETTLTACKMAQFGSTAFGLAASDPKLNELGLNDQSSMRDVMNFFELSQAELHEFSCNCGGAITNANMASRIETIANKGDGASLVSRVVSAIW